MSELIFRTEELTNNQIADLYVASEYEQSIIDKLKAPSPVLLIGSRGVGKSFLFKMSEIQMLQDFSKKKVLPVFLTFRKASLLKTSNPEQFQNWMLSRICSEVLRVLKKQESCLLYPADYHCWLAKSLLNQVKLMILQKPLKTLGRRQEN